MDLSISELYREKYLHLEDLSVGEYCNKARYFSHTNGPILILGETGVGKNLLAQAIHNERNRAKLRLKPSAVCDMDVFCDLLKNSDVYCWKKIRKYLYEVYGKISTCFDDLVVHVNKCLESVFIGNTQCVKHLSTLIDKSTFYKKYLITHLQQKGILSEKSLTEKAIKCICQQNFSRIDLLWMNRLVLEAVSSCIDYSEVGTFVEVTCTGVAENLFEAELFGIIEGTATGVAGREGLVEAAQHGTLFLDEVADITLYLQSKLLRLIEQKQFLPVGAREDHHSDALIICATNHSLCKLENRKFFRQDLYYRLCFSVEIPPLRKRPKDKEKLLEKFLNQEAKNIYNNHEIKTPQWINKVSDEEYKVDVPVNILKLLAKYPWFGNVREMKYAIRTILYSAISTQIKFIHFPLKMQKHFFTQNIKKYFPEDIDFEDIGWNSIRDEYISFLAGSGLKRSTIAKRLGVDESVVSYRMRGVTYNPISVDELFLKYLANIHSYLEKDFPKPATVLAEILGVDRKTVTKYLNQLQKSEENTYQKGEQHKTVGKDK